MLDQKETLVCRRECALPLFGRVDHQGGGTQDIDTIHVQRQCKVVRNLTTDWDNSTFTNLQHKSKNEQIETLSRRSLLSLLHDT